MLPEQLVRYRRTIIFFLHLLLIPFGYWIAFALRFDFSIPEQYQALFGTTLMYLLPLRLLVFRLFGVYHGWLRHAGLQDLVDLVKAITISTALLMGALFFVEALDDLPRSILILDWILALLLFGGARFVVRWVREGRYVWDGSERRATPALIVGAGEAAERLLRQVRRGGAGFRPVGLVDDDPTKARMKLHGVKVLGTTADLGRLIREHGAQLVVIAAPSATREEMKRLVELCSETKIEFKIVPPLHELLDGRARVHQLRRVDVDDLLGRSSITLDLDSVRRDLRGRVVLITGGAGSIGSELARQVAACSPKALVLVEQAESPLYFINLELAKAYPELDVVPVVADVTDSKRLDGVFAAYRPDYVYHAAAYKHVPLMEANIVEAVRNNVCGTLFVAEAAARYGASKFVLISTDKAVHPSSIMGATKRVAERIVLGWPFLRASGTDFRAVRFGNVLGSDGSVVPLFRRQLAAGGPLTVTHPDVTRYFMTVPEAVQLVLQSATLSQAADRICMLEMGEPVRIMELAENLIRLSGLEPYKDVPIVVTGLRPGEKLHEELMSEVEETIPTSVDKIRVVRTDEADGGAIETGVKRLTAAVAEGRVDDLVLSLCAMVPECVSPLRDLGIRAARGELEVLPWEEHTTV